MNCNIYKLGDCLSMIENGATIKQKKGAKGFPITRIESLSNDIFNRDKLGYADISDITPYKRFVLDDKDLIMSHINSRQFLGRTVLYRKRNNEAIIHGMNVLRIKTNTQLLDPIYAYYYFKTTQFRKSIDNIRKDAINQSSINISDICRLKVTIPSVEEQEKISHALQLIDRKIELNRQVNDNLEAMAKQLYDYWFVQFDFPNEEGKPYRSSGGKMVWNETLKREIPKEWCIVKLRDFIELLDSKRIPLSSMKRAERKGNYPYYGATGIMDYVNDYIFDGDYILLAEDGSTSDVDGFPIVQYIWGKNWVNNHAHIIQPKDKQYLLYTYQMLKNIPAKQIETGSIQKKISQENLCGYNIVLPNTILMRMYDMVIKPLWELRKICITEINDLTKQRDELLPLLMNGQASVNYHLP